MIDDVVERLRDPDRWVLVFALAAFALWLASGAPLRSWASEAGVRDHWPFDVAPSFFAGGTIAGWQALATDTPPLGSALLAGAFVSLTEVAQLVMPQYTADLRDVAAGLAGAALTFPFLRWRSRHRAV